MKTYNFHINFYDSLRKQLILQINSSLLEYTVYTHIYFTFMVEIMHSIIYSGITL